MATLALFVLIVSYNAMLYSALSVRQNVHSRLNKLLQQNYSAIDSKSEEELTELRNEGLLL